MDEIEGKTRKSRKTHKKSKNDYDDYGDDVNNQGRLDMNEEHQEITFDDDEANM